MLDTDSRLEFSFAQATRHLRLAKGRVRLSVTNNEQPLRVEAGGGVVTAGDAAFDIGFEENGALSVTVLRGEADIRFGGAPATGHPPDKVLHTGRTDERRVGTECVRTYRTRRSPLPSIKKSMKR